MKFDEELVIEENILEKQFRLSRVTRLKRPFFEKCMEIRATIPSPLPKSLVSHWRLAELSWVVAK